MEIVSREQNDNVICDRSVLDNYAYLVHAEGVHPILDQLVTYWMETYDYLFKVPVGLVLQKNGVRDVDTEFQIAIDRLVDQMLQERGLRYYNLSGSNRDIWMAFVMSLVEREDRPAPTTSRQIPLPISGDTS